MNTETKIPAEAKLLVSRSSISLDHCFRQEIYQAIQDDDFYASILYEIEDTRVRELDKKNVFGCTVFDCILLAASTGRTSPGVTSVDMYQ